MDKRSKKRGGFYWVDDKPYVTVTTALGIIDKGSGLMYWFGKEIYYALAKDPSLSEQAALSAPYVTRDKAAERGSIVHSMIEVWKESKKEITTAPEQYAGYANAFYSWI